MKNIKNPSSFDEWVIANNWEYVEGVWIKTLQHGTIISDENFNKKYKKTTLELFDIYIESIS